MGLTRAGLSECGLEADAEGTGVTGAFVMGSLCKWLKAAPAAGTPDTPRSWRGLCARQQMDCLAL